MAKKVIAVMGATGSQGSGLVKAIMADKSGEFTARAITRDVNSDKAKALAAWAPKSSRQTSTMKRV